MKKTINKLKQVNLRRPKKEEIDPIKEAPKITNQTVAEHREEVLSKARKYIYPLQQSKHKIVLITTTLFIVALVGFFGYTTFALYRSKSYSTFLYGVTKVIPFPIAKAGDDFVAYENYLFELKRYIHFYQNQQKLDINSESGKQQLAEFKKRALDMVVEDAYIKQLAKQNKVSVSNKEVEDEIQVARNQNRLGSNERKFEDILRENWGWSINDFRRSLKQQLLAQKLLPVLDPETAKRADAALAELKGGADFAAVAKKYSDDVGTKDNGGEYGIPISKTSPDVPAKASDALYKLKQGEYSGVINTGYSLEIVKNIEPQSDKIRAAHIVFNFKDINTYVNDLKDQKKARLFIRP